MIPEWKQIQADNKARYKASQRGTVIHLSVVIYRDPNTGKLYKSIVEGQCKTGARAKTLRDESKSFKKLMRRARTKTKLFKAIAEGKTKVKPKGLKFLP